MSNISQLLPNYLTDASQCSPTNRTISTGQATSILRQSGLPNQHLSKIWELSTILADSSAREFIYEPEFCLAMSLVSRVLKGEEGIGVDSTVGNAVLMEIESIKRQSPASRSSVNLYQQPVSAQHPGLSTHNTGTPSITPQHTGPQQPITPNHTRNSQSNSNAWAISPAEKAQHDIVFKQWDTGNNGYITGDRARSIFGQSGLPSNILAQIWTLSDIEGRGKLNSSEFAIAMHLIQSKLSGTPLPSTLPENLIPPSTRAFDAMAQQMKNQVIDALINKKSKPAFASIVKGNEILAKELRPSSSPSSRSSSTSFLFESNNTSSKKNEQESEKLTQQIQKVQSELTNITIETTALTESLSAMQSKITETTTNLTQIDTQISSLYIKLTHTATLHTLLDALDSLINASTDLIALERVYKGGDGIQSKANELLSRRLAALGVSSTLATSTVMRKDDREERVARVQRIIDEGRGGVTRFLEMKREGEDVEMQIWEPSEEERRRFFEGRGWESEVVMGVVLGFESNRKKYASGGVKVDERIENPFGSTSEVTRDSFSPFETETIDDYSSMKPRASSPFESISTSSFQESSNPSTKPSSTLFDTYSSSFLENKPIDYPYSQPKPLETTISRDSSTSQRGLESFDTSNASSPFDAQARDSYSEFEHRIYSAQKGDTQEENDTMSREEKQRKEGEDLLNEFENAFPEIPI